MLRQILCGVAASSLVFSAVDSVPATTVLYRPAVILVGQPIPPAPFVIDPADPTTNDVIRFSAPLDREVHSNPCMAAANLGGQPILDIDEANREIRIGFDGVYSDICTREYDPVTGAMGDFGPLAAGNWTFHNSHGGSLDFTVTGTSLADFDGSGTVDLTDLNALTAEADLAAGMAVPPADARFDLNGDGMLDGADLDQWLVDAATFNGHDGPYSRGDANLDGDVDIWAEDGTGDAQTLISNLGTTFGAVWSEGDFNGDGDVDVWQHDGGGDAQTLTVHLDRHSVGSLHLGESFEFLTPVPALLNAPTDGQAMPVRLATTVPEPSTIVLLSMAIAASMLVSRRRGGIGSNHIA